MLVDKDKWLILGWKVYFLEESVRSKKEIFLDLVQVFKKHGVEFRCRTPTDGNCLYHRVGEQTGMTQERVRGAAMPFLEGNEHVFGGKWIDIVKMG